jgi:hypothetical protein
MCLLRLNLIEAVPVLILAALLSPVHTFAQQGQQTLTNADIVNMTKSGIAEQTIILMVQKTANKFDTSPDALIELKKAGVSDAVLNAILTSTPSGLPSQNTDAAVQDCGETLNKALNAMGPPDTLNGVQSVRLLAQSTIQRTTGTQTFQVERVTDYSGSVYMSAQQSTGVGAKTVLTPAFNYMVLRWRCQIVPAQAQQR